MLSFDASLSNALNSSNSTAFWVCKLYYNDESAFVGVSYIDRLDGATDVALRHYTFETGNDFIQDKVSH